MRGFSQSEEPAPIVVKDRVRDLMVSVVPRLSFDEQMSLVEPDEFLEDDGKAKEFAKLFEYDDTPRMDVANEVFDLMRLAIPSVGAFVEEPFASECYAEYPDDGLEEAWVAESATEERSPFAEDAIRLIAAPSPVMMLAAPIPAAEEPVAEPEVPAIESDAPTYEVDESDALVTFSFGPSRASDGGWTVCFSFRSEVEARGCRFPQIRSGGDPGSSHFCGRMLFPTRLLHSGCPKRPSKPYYNQTVWASSWNIFSRSL